MLMQVAYIATGYCSNHKTVRFDTHVNLKSEFLDDAPTWCDRVVFSKYTSPRTLAVVAQYDWNHDEKEWDRFNSNESE